MVGRTARLLLPVVFLVGIDAGNGEPVDLGGEELDLPAVDADDDAPGELGRGEGRPAGGAGREHLAGRDLAEVEVVRRRAVLVHVRAAVPASVVGGRRETNGLDCRHFGILVQGRITN